MACTLYAFAACNLESIIKIDSSQGTNLQSTTTHLVYHFEHDLGKV
jgi:hypothetical protein